jgi:hypothetical protein
VPESNFHKITRRLIEMSIHPDSSDQAKSTFEIRGELFTTQELIELDRKKRLTNLDLPKIIRTRRATERKRIRSKTL